jgi:hypothetical protein
VGGIVSIGCACQKYQRKHFTDPFHIAIFSLNENYNVKLSLSKPPSTSSG